MTVSLPYFDTSALRPLFLHEERSRKVVRCLGRFRGVVRITRFGYAELVNAMTCAVFRGDISAEQLSGAVAHVEADLRSQRIIMADLLWRATLDRAMELSRKHTPVLGNRMLDILHIASALELGAKTLVSYDQRQIKLGKIVGLRTISP